MEETSELVAKLLTLIPILYEDALNHKYKKEKRTAKDAKDAKDTKKEVKRV